MKSRVVWTALVTGVCYAVLACGGGEKPAEPAPAPAKSEATEKKGEHAGHDHEHEGHDHGHEDGDHEHGKVRHELGSQKVGAWTISAQQADDVKAGAETVFYVILADAAPASAVRLWVGDEAATKSAKALGEKIEENRFHAHVEAPDPLAPTDQFWVEVDDGKGGTFKGSYKLAGEPAK